MTRDDEIYKRLQEIDASNFNSLHEHEGYMNGYIDGSKCADCTMIEKACEWIHTAIYLDYERSIEHRYATLEDLLNDFKKAMKGD